MKRISVFGTPTDDATVAREITKEAYEKILIVASAISQVITVSNSYNSGILDTINNNITAINGVYNISNAVNSINNDIVAIESLFADKATLDSIYADKATIDSLESIKDKLEYLHANINTLNVLYSDRTVWNSVFNYLSEINEVSLHLDSIDAVYGSLSEISSIYNSLTAITSVYNNMLDINTVAAVITDVLNVSNVSAEVSTVSNSISNIITIYNNLSGINTVASKITDINNFTAVWLGALATAPTTRTDSSALQLGDLYFNTSVDSVKVYASTGWINAGSSVNGVASAIDYIATEGQTVFNSVYDTGYVFVWRNGFKLSSTDFTATDGTTITLTNPADAGDVISIISFGSFSVTDSSLMPFDPSGTDLTSTNVESAIKEVKNGTYTKTEVNSALTNKVSTSDGLAFSARPTSQQNISSNVVTKITFQEKEFDTDNAFNLTNSRFVAPITGYYQINMSIVGSKSGASTVLRALRLFIYRNGSVLKSVWLSDDDAVDIMALSISHTVYMESGLYVEMYAHGLTSDGSAVAIGGASTEYVTMSGHRVLGV